MAQRELFADVKFFIDAGIHETLKKELNNELLAQGGQAARQVSEATHIIADTIDFWGRTEEKGPTGEAVTPLWVKRCIEHQKLLDPKYYSPNPGKIMSGVVATSSDLPRNDVEALCAGIIAYGGQWRHAFTKDVTHLFCLAPQGEKYTTAMHYKDKMGLEVLIPAWFQDCVQLQQRLPTAPYSFPNPARYKPLASLDPIGADEHPAEGIDSKLKTISTVAEKNILFRTVSEASGKPQKPEKLRTGNIWQDKRVLLGADLGLQDDLLNAVEASIHRNSGIVYVKEDEIDEVDVYVCRYRHGPGYKRAVERHITIGTVAWIFHCEQVEKLTSPLAQLCHYPIPIHKIKDFDKYEITVTNYTGEARDYLKNLIDAVGAKFSATMSKANTHVIAAHLGGQKAERALDWNIPVVNHTWLEDCFLQWKNISIGGVAGSKYSKFPTGVNFMTILGERGFVGFYDTDPRFILGENPDDPTSSSNGKQPKRPRLEQVATGSGKGTPQPQNSRGDIDQATAASRPVPSPEDNQGQAPIVEAQTESSATPKVQHVNGKTASEKRGSNAADTPRRPARTESPSPKAAKPSSTRSKPLPVLAPDAMDVDVDLDNAALDDAPGPGDGGPIAGPSKSKTPKIMTLTPHDADSEDDLDQIERTRLKSSSKPPSKPAPKSKLQSSKSKIDTSVAPSSSGRVSKAASNPSIGGNSTSKALGPKPSQPASSGVKRSQTNPDIQLLTSDDEQDQPAPPKKKTVKPKPKVTPAEDSSAGSSHGASVSEAESSRTDSISAVPGRLRRGAAAKAEAQLRDHVMPDLIRYQRDLKSSQGDVRKLHIAEVPASSKKRVRTEDSQSNDDDDGSVKNQPTARRRKVDPASSKSDPKTSSKGKGKAKAVQEDESSGIDDVDVSGTSLATVKDQTPYIATTSYDIPSKDQDKLVKMGARKVDDVTKCTHLVTGKGILRTIKFLAAVARGVHIVTPEWIKASLKADSFVASYLPKDPVGEEKYNFKLKDALGQARKHQVLAGHKFWITKSLHPTFNDLKTVILACGGEATKEMVKDRLITTLPDKRHVISCAEDIANWRTLSKQGVPIYVKEFIYNSALRQVADWDNVETQLPVKS